MLIYILVGPLHSTPIGFKMEFNNIFHYFNDVLYDRKAIFLEVWSWIFKNITRSFDRITYISRNTQTIISLINIKIGILCVKILDNRHQTFKVNVWCQIFLVLHLNAKSNSRVVKGSEHTSWYLILHRLQWLSFQFLQLQKKNIFIVLNLNSRNLTTTIVTTRERQLTHEPRPIDSQTIHIK